MQLKRRLHREHLTILGKWFDDLEAKVVTGPKGKAVVLTGVSRDYGTLAGRAEFGGTSHRTKRDAVIEAGRRLMEHLRAKITGNKRV